MALNKMLFIPALIVVVLGVVFISTNNAQAATTTNSAQVATTAYSTQAATTGMTKVTHFFPSGLRNTPAVSGDCWTTSLAAPRLDAWRCMVNNTIYDPCFSSANFNNYVICDANPVNDTNGIKVQLTKPLPASNATADNLQPWALRLANGADCSFLTGATSIIDNQRVNYSCTNNAVILGSPKEGKVWTVNEQLPGQQSVITEPVVQAWT